MLQILRVWRRMYQRARITAFRNRALSSPSRISLLRCRILFHLGDVYTSSCDISTRRKACLCNSGSRSIPFPFGQGGSSGMYHMAVFSQRPIFDIRC
jgi:hypothetical protein